MESFDYNKLVLFAIAVMQFLNALVALLAFRASSKAKEDIAEVKIHTNSMKDALVAAARKEGIVIGRASGEVGDINNTT